MKGKFKVQRKEIALQDIFKEYDPIVYVKEEIKLTKIVFNKICDHCIEILDINLLQGFISEFNSKYKYDISENTFFIVCDKLSQNCDIDNLIKFTKLFKYEYVMKKEHFLTMFNYFNERCFIVKIMSLIGLCQNHFQQQHFNIIYETLLNKKRFSELLSFIRVYSSWLTNETFQKICKDLQNNYEIYHLANLIKRFENIFIYDITFEEFRKACRTLICRGWLEHFVKFNTLFKEKYGSYILNKEECDMIQRYRVVFAIPEELEKLMEVNGKYKRFLNLKISV